MFSQSKCLIVLIISILCGIACDASGQQQTNRNAASRNQPTFTTKWTAEFVPAKLQVSMKTQSQVELNIMIVDTTQGPYIFHLRSEHPHLAVPQKIEPEPTIDVSTGTWNGNVTIDALFLGQTVIYVELINTATNETERSKNQLELIIVRKMRLVDHIFTASVIILVSLLYINFGAAIDLNILRGILTRPIGPTIGFISQFILMPLLSYGLGLLIFPNSVEMQLGLFFTGVSPSGGASNIWAVILGGNINLSVIMTTISNIAAFGMMPLWLFTLGTTIFNRANLKVPYANIASYAVALIVPLGIGLGIQKWSPRLTRILVRLLKPISSALILFIIIFAIVTNIYIFELFSWRIVVAGLALPWLGYALAWCLAKLCKQNPADALTIAIEAGIQNTGIAIFLLRSLPQPQADLTTVIPVSVAIMTPFPLLILYLIRKFTVTEIKESVLQEEHRED